ncbi:hypothetical protein K491DRAFT_693836 [Lophiostoma macrostomum CBS 122681]|uniref:Phosphatidylinositol N-acetylglucosaminyltransferase subunit H conserved domain-containing protein n=1 Tax=Lophiostoma macrostomum CBS 122681 TaxID=1314788 RepID=A0A6A6T423_9PLEO|nr:hypothetical protein K491DRAFT_693836 [Lophiostoma macrostomum CBS 122681]
MLQLLQRLTSPPTQRLTTLQPTPSTVGFTVSTRPVPETLPALLQYYISILLRLITGVCAIAVLLLKWKPDITRNPLSAIFGLWVEQFVAAEVAGSLRWRYVVPAVAAVWYAILRRGYTEESILLLHGLGLQTSTSSSMYLRPATTRFIPTTSIQDIFIHEAFKGFEVRFYLAIVIKGEEDVVVVFPNLLPRREILEVVWRGARKCLYGGGTVVKVKQVEEEG